jgi:recombinational DNA repair protein RecR
VLIGNFVLEIHGMTMDYFMVLFTTSCFANMLGLNISASFNSAVTIYILIPFLIIPQLLLSGVIVKFDKLNPTITLQNTVPFTGEVMTSRWAFEALAVNQFKKNQYERQFYAYDKAMANADFKKNYWIPNLNARIDKCENNMKDKSLVADVQRDLDLIKFEIQKEMKSSKKIVFKYLDQLTTSNFNARVADEIRNHLKSLNTYYIKIYNKNSDNKDKKIAERNTANKEAFLKEKNEYENESLNDLVRNSTEFNKILESEGQLIQRADPVFLDPVQSEYGRAHFFAPRKKMFGKYFDTYWFNLTVIWAMSLLLAITLYFDVLKRMLDGLENVFSRIFPSKSR